MSEQKAVSLRPGDAQEGGFLDDVDVTIKSLRAVHWDYKGKADPCAAIEATFLTDEGKERIEYYRVGKPDKLVPNAENTKFLPVSGTGGIMKKSKGWYFVTSLINAGFPEDKVTDDLSVFNNTRVHVNITALPEKMTDDAGKDKENKAILVTKVVTLPWEQKSGSKKPAPAASTAKPTAAAAPASAPQSASDIVTKAIAECAKAASDAGGSLPRIKLSQQVFRQLAQDTDRNAVVKLVGDPAWLQTLNEMPVEVGGEVKSFTFDGTALSLN